eukprot:CAMPEP_0115547390 /NCGR_PEP_ID=MMETSP0271-20121206/93622_1 /TAXON_ID=71861 /ORGANISM="Scrippsiella trochoidea, Strain CCMP3099" /LENGTH=282 /DNA_ID=CAMNT_0002980821 /DNA_START=14 /DNA_END=863 /DNA_ORIENTATION=-
MPCLAHAKHWLTLAAAPQTSQAAAEGVRHPGGRRRMAAAGHYAAVTTVYETAWCYQNNGDFQRWLLDRVQDALPETCKTLVDIGCGTANFSGVLQRESAIRVIGVEPSAEMAAKASEYGVQVEVQDALSWAAGASANGSNYDAIMLKEVRHHIDDPAKLYVNLAGALAPGGKILLLTRPDKSDGYPFPAKAHDRWAAGVEMPLQTHVKELEAAGLSVHVQEEKYKVQMDREEWIRLVRGRFWSHLSALSDNEINDGLKELNLPDQVEFDDCMIFVIATHGED